MLVAAYIVPPRICERPCPSAERLSCPCSWHYRRVTANTPTVRCCMTCTAIAVGPYLRQPSLLQPHRLPLQHLTFVLLVIALLLTPGLANARALKQAIPSDATPSETFEASPQPTLSAAALQANPAFSLTLDSYYSRGLKHSRGLKQTSCPPSGAAISKPQQLLQLVKAFLF